MGHLLVTNKSDRLKIFLRHNGKWASRCDLKENRGRDCDIDMVCFKGIRNKTLYRCVCVWMYTGIFVNILHILHTHTQISLNVLFLISIQRESSYNSTCFEGERHPSI